MTPYQRARRAIYKAHKETEGFEHGDMASGELMGVLEEYLKDEFRPRKGAK